MRCSDTTLRLIEQAMRERPVHSRFAAWEIGAQVGRTRQMVYHAIRQLNEHGHDIRKAVGYGIVVYGRAA
jgi:hypothetical protein